MLKILRMLCDDGLIIGIISGIISSIMVTQVYRIMDKKRDRFGYLNRLNTYTVGLRSKLSAYENGEISDSYIVNVYNYLTKTEVPKKESWVHLCDKERKAANDFKELYEIVQRKVFECKFDIDSVNAGNSGIQNEIDKLKNEVIMYAFKALKVEVELASIVREYYKY